jgi:hypothetical protein
MIAGERGGILILAEIAMHQALEKSEISDPLVAIPERRAIIVLLASAIAIVRAAPSFLAPQLYAEDGLLFQAAYNHGWHSLIEPIGGALNLYGSLIALLASKAPLIVAPAIEAYGAFAALVLIVFMAMSPRFELPFRSLAALAIACAPAAFELIGVLANGQWILPLGLFILLFSRPSSSSAVSIAEAAFVFFVGLEGPVPIFLVPLFFWQTLATKGPARHRLLLLTGLLTITAAIQLSHLRDDYRHVFNLVEPAPYSLALWVTMPVRWLDAFWPLNQTLIGFGRGAVIVVILAAVALGRYALKQPYRDIKIAMIYLAAIILLSGMLKYRANLQTVVEFNGRYIYAGSVFFFWFFCIAAYQFRSIRNCLVVLTGLLLINGILAYPALRPRAQHSWSSYIDKVEAATDEVAIPIAPEGWQIVLSPRSARSR